jgi:adenine-specific DNA-methyltransferase
MKKAKLIQTARNLRKYPTKAEAILWQVLRNKNLEGFRFRRQHPIGPYIADFFCPKKKLIIEVDGGQHAEQGKKDAERTAFFESKGCRVIRFWNNEVLGNIQGVVDRIAEELDN